MTDEQRDGYDNLLFLCANCHTMIDNPTKVGDKLQGEIDFPTDDLIKIKSEHEQKVAAERAKLGLFNTPKPRPLFVGREESLRELKKLLTEDKDVAISASLEGLAGIGKTETAIRLAHELARDGAFPGGIYWLDAESLDLTRAWSSTSIAGKMGIEGDNPTEVATQVVSRIDSNEKKALVILDNVTSWSGSKKPHPLPEGHHLQFLLTTRERHLGGSLIESYDLGFLDADASQELLTSIAKRDIEPGVDDLLTYLGGHSLAIELAGTYLRATTAMNASQYLDQLTQGHNPDGIIAPKIRYEKTVAQALDQVWSVLEEHTKRAWQTAACFAAAPVGIRLSEAASLDADTLRSLEQFHLIKFEGDRWQMHRLVHAYGETAGSDREREEAKQRFTNGCEQYADTFSVSSGYQDYRSEHAHFDLAVNRARSQPLDEGACRLLAKVALAQHGTGDLAGARTLEEEVLATRTKLLGEDHPHTLTSKHNLASTLSSQGDLAGARIRQEEVLASRTKLFGEDHPHTLTSKGNLASMLKDQGDPAGARTLEEEVLASLTKLVGEDHPHTLTSKSNLASTLWQLGDLSGARTLSEEVLASRTKLLGEDHLHTLTSKGNLASTLKSQGDLAGARTLEEEVLASLTKLLGEDHPHTLTSKNNLASTLWQLGDPAGARTLEEEVLASRTKLLGEDHPHTLTSKNNLASTLKGLGDLAGARTLWRQALSGAEKVWGSEHPNTQSIKADLECVEDRINASE